MAKVDTKVDNEVGNEEKSPVPSTGEAGPQAEVCGGLKLGQPGLCRPVQAMQARSGDSGFAHAKQASVQAILTDLAI